MAIQTITYDDKVALNENPSVAEINKVTDNNMNEIKNVVNNNATETSTNTTNVNTNTTKITNLQAIATATFTNDKTNLPSGVLAFDTLNSSSNKLTLSNGGIRIGTGISKVLVSGNVFFQFTAAQQNYVYIMIRKNTTNISIAIGPEAFANAFISVPFTPVLVDVQEGDIFYMFLADAKTGTYRGEQNTWLTIQVIE